MPFFKSNYVIKKVFIAFIVLSLISLSAPKKTEAQYVDVANTLKEYGLDTVAYTAAQIVLKKLTSKTVNWINSGFKGNPSYVTDPGQFFLDVADNTASDILSSTKLNQLCSPFKVQVRLALVKNYIADDNNYSCTLSKIKDNYDQFTEDFSQGGWDGWFEVTQTSGNNPFGAYFNAQGGLIEQVDSKKSAFTKELEQGQGFLSFKRCKAGKGLTAGEVQAFNWINGTNLKAGDCLDKDKETATPGTVINDQLTKSLGSKWGKLEAADEISEIMTALVTQLIEQVIGGVKGLKGASERPAGGGPSVADQSGNEAEPKPKVDPNQIRAEQGGINCSSNSSSSGDGENTSVSGTPESGSDGSEPTSDNPDGNGSSSSSNSSSNCVSTPTTITGLPNVDFGGGGAGGGGSCPVPTTPKSLCEGVDSSRVLAILNKYRPSNAGITAAIIEVQGIYPQAKVLPHARLDKIDFGGGLVVDVIIGAVGGTAEGRGWTWGIDCECGNTGTVPGTGNVVPADEFVGGPSTGEGGGAVPTNLIADVREERAKFGVNVSGADLGKLLNAVAWRNRVNGWGLSRKTGGERCNSPVGEIACDILYHKPSNIIFDVLIAAGEVSTPTWNELGENTDANRPWVAPVQP